MRRSVTIIGFLTAALSPGCQLFTSTARNLYNEPSVTWEEFRFDRRARSLARESWRERPERPTASCDFRDGYLDGYADYLVAGRITDPRPAPPKRYQKNTYFTPDTLRAVEDYFAGFHIGAEDAKASGQRQRMIVPVVFPVRADDTGPVSVALPPPIEKLPPPREAPKRPGGVPEERGPEVQAAATLRAPR